MEQQNWHVFSRGDLVRKRPPHSGPGRTRPARNGSAGGGPPRKTARRWRRLIAGLLLVALLALAGAWGAWSAGLLPPPPVWQTLMEKMQSVALPHLFGERGETSAAPRFGLPWLRTGGQVESGAEGPPGTAPENATNPPGEASSGEPGEAGQNAPGARNFPDSSGSGVPSGSGSGSGAFGALPPEARSLPSPEQAAIEAYYLARLETICRSYEGRLNGLIGQAQDEYTSARRQGQKVSVISLAKRYLAAGNALEKQCDADFYAVLADFKAELRKNSFPLDKPREAQKEYEQTKAARKRQIITAAAKML